MNSSDPPFQPQSKESPTQLRLYIASGTYASDQALINIFQVCENHYPGRYTLEIIDILNEPLQALNDSVLTTPTLVRLAPRPQKSIHLHADNTEMIMHTIGAPSEDESTP